MKSQVFGRAAELATPTRAPEQPGGPARAAPLTREGPS